MKRLTLVLALSLLAAACDNPTEPDDGWIPISGDVEAVASSEASGGSYLAIQVNDPAADQTGAIDVRKMRLVFDVETGEYRIVLTAAKEAPFVGTFRINVNLFNASLGTTGYPAVFNHNMADFNLTEPATRIVLAGTSAILTEWERGQKIYTNSLDGIDVAPGINLFRSGVSNFPMGFLTNEDVIAPRDRSEPVTIHGAGGLHDEPTP